MSIAEGVRLGLDLSRGARQESRADQRHQMAMKQAQEDSAFQARMRPLQEQSAQLGLRDLEGRISHGEQLRPLELEAQQLGLSEARNSAEHNKQVRPLQLEAQRESLAGARQARGQSAAAFEQAQEDRGMALRKQWVAEQTPLEYARFQRTGQFSDRFLRESMAIGSPVAPLRLVDGAHIDALDTLQDLLDPRRPSNPYDGNKLFEAANLLLAPELNNGGINPHNGKKITDKRIVAAHPARDRSGNPMPGKLYVELEMTDETGEKYRAPATVGRGSGDDEELRTIDLGQLVQRVNAQQMFSKALNQDPAARDRLIQQGQKLTKKDGSPLKSDEVSWQGRARKFDDVYKLYSEDTSLKTAEGAPLVDFEAFEWTQGDNQKLAFVRAAAKENSRIYAEAMPLMRKEPAKAQQLLQEWVDPVELYQMSQQSSSKPAVDGANRVMDKINQPEDAPQSVARNERELEREEQQAFLAQPDWHLEKDLPRWAMKDHMNSERWAQRREHFARQQQEQEQAKSQEQTKALSYLATEYPELNEAEKRRWVLQNGRHLDRDTYKRLIKETQPVRG